MRTNVDASLNVSPQSIQAASIILATLPILFVYPFLQKYFVKGVLVGSVKG
jgi:putative aldouronate transport system permease protein